MIHIALIIVVFSLAVPVGLYAMAFLIALVDCVYAFFFPHPAPPLVDDSLGLF